MQGTAPRCLAQQSPAGSMQRPVYAARRRWRSEQSPLQVRPLVRLAPRPCTRWHRRSRGGRPRQHSPTQLVHGLARVGVNHGTVVVDSSVGHARATKVLLVPLNVLRIPGAVQDGADPWRSAKHGREQGGQRSPGPGGCTEAPNAPARSFRAAACGSCPRGPCPGTALLRAPPAGPAGAPCRPHPTSAEK